MVLMAPSHADSDKGARASSSGSHEGVLAAYDKTGSLVIMTLAKGYLAVLLANTFRIVDLIKASRHRESCFKIGSQWIK